MHAMMSDRAGRQPAGDWALVGTPWGHAAQQAAEREARRILAESEPDGCWPRTAEQSLRYLARTTYPMQASAGIALADSLATFCAMTEAEAFGSVANG